jgi:hypothetical protein
MTSLSGGASPNEELDRNASIFRAAVERSKDRGLGPIAFLAITLLVSILFATVVAVGGIAAGKRFQRGFGTFITKVAPPAPAKVAVKTPPPPPPTIVMPQGPDAFAK